MIVAVVSASHDVFSTPSARTPITVRQFANAARSVERVRLMEAPHPTELLARHTHTDARSPTR